MNKRPDIPDSNSLGARSNLINSENHDLHHSDQSTSKNMYARNRMNAYQPKLVILFLIIFVVILSAFCFTIFILASKLNALRSLTASSLFVNNRNDDNTNECKTSTCYKTSNFILDNLNQTAEPCHDFYEFTCGIWQENDSEEKDHFTIAYERMLQDISDILKMPVKQGDSGMVENFKKYYQSCLNQTDIEYNSDSQFLNLMLGEFGEWPMVPLLNKNKNSNFKSTMAQYSSKSFLGIEDHLARLTSLRMPLLFRFESNDFNNSKILMQLVVPQDFCTLQNFLPNNSQTYNEFFKLATKIRNSMFESLNDVDIYNANYVYPVSFEVQVEEMIKLAKQLYFVNDNRYLCGQPRGGKKTVNMLNAKELDEKLVISKATNRKMFDFLKYISYLSEGATTKIKEDTQVIISSLTLSFLNDLFNGLNNELKFSQEQFRRAFTNFVYFHSIFSLVKPLELFSTPHIHVKFPIRYYHAFFEYSKRVNYVSPLDSFKSIYRINREQNCAYSVIDAFSVVDSLEQSELQRLFLTEKFDSRIKEVTSKMLESLINTSIEIVNKQDWIDEKTKEIIIENMNKMENRIVYSDSVFDPESIKNKSKQIHYNLTNHYIENIFIITKKAYEKEFDLLETQQSQRIRSKKYVFDIFLANLMYFKEHNTLLMPAGVLIEPIFNVDNPIYLNYATIGAYMTHELWHMVHEDLLRSDASSKKYNDLLECLHHNYVDYAKNRFGIEIDGSTSISEQIADTFGVLVAYKTYLKQMGKEDKGGGVNSLLPGLKYDQKQLFFIRYAQSYCRKRKIANAFQFEQFHVIHEYRAFQASLIPEFKDIFSCKEKSKDYRQCKIFNID